MDSQKEFKGSISGPPAYSGSCNCTAGRGDTYEICEFTLSRSTSTRALTLYEQIETAMWWSPFTSWPATAGVNFWHNHNLVCNPRTRSGWCARIPQTSQTTMKLSSCPSREH